MSPDTNDLLCSSGLMMITAHNIDIENLNSYLGSVQLLPKVALLFDYHKQYDFINESKSCKLIFHVIWKTLLSGLDIFYLWNISHHSLFHVISECSPNLLILLSLPNLQHCIRITTLKLKSVYKLLECMQFFEDIVKIYHGLLYACHTNAFLITLEPLHYKLFSARSNTSLWFSLPIIFLLMYMKFF